MRLSLFLSFIILVIGCKSDMDSNVKIDQYSYNLGVVAGFSELVAAGVKKMAFSAPMKPEIMDEFIDEAEKTAARHGVSVYREKNLIKTDLFSSDVAEGMDVLLLYKGDALDVYNQLKDDKETLEREGAYERDSRRSIARRLGRLLSYSPRQINRLLSEQTTYRTMDDFGIRANNLFLYYRDLKTAGKFYTQIMGMELVADYEMALILRMTTDSYLILVDATKGMHTADEPKSVALALLTDQLDEWYTYLKSQDVNIKYDYKPKEGSAHDGFVIVDPEGYLLEIERFNQHPENEDFVPQLKKNMLISIKQDANSKVPKGLQFHSTITWLYHKDVLGMEGYYQNVLGLEIMADQGWTKIYKVSDTGYMAIVDERRGMNKYSDNKAVNVGFILDDLQGWYDYVSENEVMDLYKNELGTGPETRYKSFVGFGPELYYYEFDAFYPHKDNDLLLKYMDGE
jgi:catechol 2,3-dioxygenase-like lactoylglutathione lyase family enzyme